MPWKELPGDEVVSLKDVVFIAEKGIILVFDGFDFDDPQGFWTFVPVVAMHGKKILKRFWSEAMTSCLLSLLE